MITWVIFSSSGVFCKSIATKPCNSLPVIEKKKAFLLFKTYKNLIGVFHLITVISKIFMALFKKFMATGL